MGVIIQNQGTVAADAPVVAALVMGAGRDWGDGRTGPLHTGDSFRVSLVRDESGRWVSRRYTVRKVRIYPRCVPNRFVIDGTGRSFERLSNARIRGPTHTQSRACPHVDTRM